MAVNTTTLFWTIHSPTAGEPGDGAIVQLSLAGGTSTTLASEQSSDAIAVNDTSVSWLAYGLAEPGPVNVMSVPVGGGMPTTLVSAPNANGTIAIDSTSVYWIDCPSATKPPGCTLMKVPSAGGTATTLASWIHASGGSTSESLVVDGTSAYFSTDGVLVRVPVGGGAPTTLVSADPTGIAVDATSVYWVDVGCSGSVCGTIKKLTPK